MNEFEAKTQLKFKMRDLNGGVVEDYIKVKHTTVWLSKFFFVFFPSFSSQIKISDVVLIMLVRLVVNRDFFCRISALK